jgi:uncharacterized protein YjbI with pentapeptide repeats
LPLPAQIAALRSDVDLGGADLRTADLRGADAEGEVLDVLVQTRRNKQHRKVSASNRDQYAAFRVTTIADGDLDSIELSAQNPARNTDIFAARILGLNHRLFET